MVTPRPLLQHSEIFHPVVGLLIPYSNGQRHEVNLLSCTYVSVILMLL